MNELLNGEQPETPKRHLYWEIVYDTAGKIFPDDTQFLESVKGRGRDIFEVMGERLKQYPLDNQRLFLSELCKNLHIPNFAELGEYLAVVNNIAWFSPKEELDKAQLSNLINQSLMQLNYPPQTHPSIKIVYGWQQASSLVNTPHPILLLLRRNTGGKNPALEQWKNAIDEARHAIPSTNGATLAGGIARLIAFEGVDRIVKSLGDESPGMTGGVRAIDYSSYGAQWIAAKESMPQKGYTKGNPFKTLVYLFGKGYWPLGMVSRTPVINFKPEFVVAAPSRNVK